jgi:Na+-translocating ferredoxin:NAD+ oxidoreductase RnfG subunit
MELSDVVLALVSIISTGLMAVMKANSKTIKDIESRITMCQINLHKDFVHRDEYSHQIDKIEKMLNEIYSILREGQKK